MEPLAAPHDAAPEPLGSPLAAAPEEPGSMPPMELITDPRAAYLELRPDIVGDDVWSFYRPRIPMLPELNHRYGFPRWDLGDDDGDGDARRSVGHKRPRVGASREAVRGLREVRAGEARHREEECAVCLQSLAAEETLREMPCAHAFHQRCIFRWLRTSRLCPLCRHELPPMLHHEDDDDDDEEEDEQERSRRRRWS
ncbi:hypothetical protein ACP4OV_014818 [Aristida adscensionis]